MVVHDNFIVKFLNWRKRIFTSINNFASIRILVDFIRTNWDHSLLTDSEIIKSEFRGLMLYILNNYLNLRLSNWSNIVLLSTLEEYFCINGAFDENFIILFKIEALNLLWLLFHSKRVIQGSHNLMLSVLFIICSL